MVKQCHVNDYPVCNALFPECMSEDLKKIIMFELNVNT